MGGAPFKDWGHPPKISSCFSGATSALHFLILRGKISGSPQETETSKKGGGVGRPHAQRKRSDLHLAQSCDWKWDLWRWRWRRDDDDDDDDNETEPQFKRDIKKHQEKVRVIFRFS